MKTGFQNYGYFKWQGLARFRFSFGSKRLELYLLILWVRRHSYGIFLCIFNVKGRKGSQVERRGEGAKWVAFLMSLADTQALRDFALSLQRREDWNSALPETRPEQNRTRI